MKQEFAKYHGLGNDYLVVEPGALREELDPGLIAALCDRHYGAGSDGVLLGPLPPVREPRALCSVRIFNPDGSEAEKSGNGLRIFARYLRDSGRVGAAPFLIETLGGTVCCRVHADSATVTVSMGRVSFRSDDIPVTGPPREVLDEVFALPGGGEVRACAATIGNPHCVVLGQPVTAERACEIGPGLERHPAFPRRINVQLMEPVDANTIRIEIWERGAGYTLASGSSACACAAVARRLGLCGQKVCVRMPGGDLHLGIGEDYDMELTGPVAPVFHGWMDPEWRGGQMEVGS